MTVQFSLTELSLAVILQRAAMGTVMLGCYGFVITTLLSLNGEKGPQHDGRLTLDPFRHLSLLGLTLLIIAKIGWIIPLESDSRKCRGGILGYIVCILIAGLAMIALAHGMAGLRVLSLIWFSHTSAIYAISLLNVGIDLALGIGFAAFLPLPPFMLGRIWYQIWPAVQEKAEKIDIAFGCLFILAFLMLPSRISANIIATLRNLIQL